MTPGHRLASAHSLPQFTVSPPSLVRKSFSSPSPTEVLKQGCTGQHSTASPRIPRAPGLLAHSRLRVAPQGRWAVPCSSQQPLVTTRSPVPWLVMAPSSWLATEQQPGSRTTAGPWLSPSGTRGAWGPEPRAGGSPASRPSLPSAPGPAKLQGAVRLRARERWRAGLPRGRHHHADQPDRRELVRGHAPRAVGLLPAQLRGGSGAPATVTTPPCRPEVLWPPSWAECYAPPAGPTAGSPLPTCSPRGHGLLPAPGHRPGGWAVYLLPAAPVVPSPAARGGHTKVLLETLTSSHPFKDW